MRKDSRKNSFGQNPWWQRPSSGLSLFPLLWYAVFLLGPLGLVLVTALATRGAYGGISWTLSLGNFARAFDPLYLKILTRSLVLALSTTVLCAGLGLPIAYTMATAARRTRGWLIFLLALPFLTNLIVRLQALKVFAAYDGALAHLLTALKIPFDPFSLSQNTGLVLFGMVSTYLPFMVYPLFSSLERFDFTLIEAAEDLGAQGPALFTRVVFPLIKRPLLSGSLLVFIPALGEFLIPDLLGGAKTMLTGNLITEQFLKARDWPFGSALAVLFITLLLFAVAFLERRGQGSRAQGAYAESPHVESEMP